ncbi:MAG: type II toxin-antitoxin system RelE/ParE family toxin [Phormidium sp.]
MGKVRKRPQVIRDLSELATYIAEGNLEAAERFLVAAEETFKLLGEMPQIGKVRECFNSNLMEIRQRAIKGFRNYLIFYRSLDNGVEILRVVHGAREIESILDELLTEDESE